MKSSKAKGFFLVVCLSVFVECSGSDNRTGAEETQATLQDYWNGKASFVFQNHFGFPTKDTPYFQHVNTGMSIVVRDGIWYLFHVEYAVPKDVPVYCKNPSARSRVLVRFSTDQGRTWSEGIAIVSPQEGSYNECRSNDGGAFYDIETNTWHYLYQAYARDHVWRSGHASLQASSPMQAFQQDNNNPVVVEGSLWKKILGDNTRVTSEGTWDIIEKRNGYFYVTFHGYDHVNGYRGVARTKDFISWEAINHTPIFAKEDSNRWNVPWNSNGSKRGGAGTSIGGGAGNIIKEGNYYYAIMEAGDINLGARLNQNWVDGLVRSTSLGAEHWEQMPGGQSSFAYNSRSVDANGNTVQTGVTYGQLFRDSNGDIYFIVGRYGNTPAPKDDPRSGIYLYKLVASAPFAAYAFREGPRHAWTDSDTLSPGYLEARMFNTQWGRKGSDDHYAVLFNGVNSYIQMPDNPQFNLQNGAALSVHLLLNAIPKRGSALIAGKLGSYWFELHEDRKLCFWIVNGAGSHSACSPVEIGQWTTYEARYQSPYMAIYKNGKAQKIVTVSGAELVQNSSFFQLGSASPNSHDLYRSFNGQVDAVSLSRLH